MRLALFILFALLMNSLVAQNLSVKQNLTSPFMTWVFNEEGKTEPMSAAVPGNVHRDLVLNKVIPDPLIGTNEGAAQWVADKNWEYTLNDFVCEPNILSPVYIALQQDWRSKIGAVRLAR